MPFVTDASQPRLSWQATKCLHVVIPVAVGSGIYLAWRSPTLLMFHWLNAVGLAEWVMFMRELARPLRSGLPDWLLFSLPNALWTYAITWFIADVWRRESLSASKIIWCLIGPLLAIGSEIGQALQLIPGVFDTLDLITSVLAATLAATAILFPINERVTH